MIRRLSPAALALTVLLACSTFGTTDGTEAPVDGGSAAPDSATSIPEGGASQPGCDGVFCSSFEETPYSSGWDGIRTSADEALLYLDLQRAEDAPWVGAAFLRLTIRKADIYDKLYLQKSVPLAPPPRTLTLSFGLRAKQVDATPSTTPPRTVVVSLAWSHSTAAFAFLGRTLTASLESERADGETLPPVATTSAILPDTNWHPMTIELVSGTPSTARFTVDKGPLGTLSFSGPFPTDLAEVQLGAVDCNGQFKTETVLDFDDVHLIAK